MFDLALRVGVIQQARERLRSGNAAGACGLEGRLIGGEVGGGEGVVGPRDIWFRSRIGRAGGGRTDRGEGSGGGTSLITSESDAE